MYICINKAEVSGKMILAFDLVMNYPKLYLTTFVNSLALPKLREWAITGSQMAPFDDSLMTPINQPSNGTLWCFMPALELREWAIIHQVTPFIKWVIKWHPLMIHSCCSVTESNYKIWSMYSLLFHSQIYRYYNE